MVQFWQNFQRQNKLNQHFFVSRSSSSSSSATDKSVILQIHIYSFTIYSFNNSLANKMNWIFSTLCSALECEYSTGKFSMQILKHGVWNVLTGSRIYTVTIHNMFKRIRCTKCIVSNALMYDCVWANTKDSLHRKWFAMLHVCMCALALFPPLLRF